MVFKVMPTGINVSNFMIFIVLLILAVFKQLLTNLSANRDHDIKKVMTSYKEIYIICSYP